MKSKNRVTTKTVIHELLVDPAKVSAASTAYKTGSHEAICEGFQ